jgi:hypothetical protein
MNYYIHLNNQNRWHSYVTYVSIVLHLLPGFAADAAWMLPEEKLWAVKLGVATFIPSASVWLLSHIRCTMWRSQLKLIRAWCHKSYANIYDIFFTKVNQATFKIIFMYNTEQLMCWQLQTLSIFCSAFSVAIMAADSSCKIYVIHTIPGYPVE